MPIKRKLAAIMFTDIVGCVFGDEIIFHNVYLQYGQEQVEERIIEGEYLGTLDSKVYIREKFGKPIGYNCVQVISILNNNREPIEYDCSLNNYIPESIFEIDDAKKFLSYPIPKAIVEEWEKVK